jgi:hypothetical protein
MADSANPASFAGHSNRGARPVNTRVAARIRRQVRLNLRKLFIRQPELIPDSSPLPFGTRESQLTVQANTFMGPDPRKFHPDFHGTDLTFMEDPAPATSLHRSCSPGDERQKTP